MRVRYYLVAVLLAAAGYGIGTMLVPRGGELALVYYKAGRYQMARKILERALTAGDLTPSNIHYAANTYLRLGEVRRAATLVAHYVHAHPNDMAGWRMLGELYQEAGKPALYTHNLEEIERRQPSAKTRLLLKALYYEQGMNRRWERMLKRVVDDGDGSPKDYFDLAQLMASRGKKKEAVRYLAALRKRAPKAFGLFQSGLFAVLNMNLGHAETAMSAVRAYLKKKPGIAAASYFADLFQQRGHAVAALDVLLPYAPKAAKDPELLQTLTALEVTTGHAARALKRLRRLDERDQLEPVQINLLISTALAAQNWNEAKRAFARAETASLSQDVVLQVVNEAASRNDEAFGRVVNRRLTEAFKRINPIAAARVALLIGDRRAAEHWADLANSRKVLTNEERLNLIAILVALKRTEQAEKHLRAVVRGGPVPDAQMIRLAALLRKFGMIADGIKLFDRLEPTRKSPWLKAGRLILTSNDRNASHALDWLNKLGLTGTGSRDLLVAIYDAAYNAKLNHLAVAAATRLVALHDDLQNRMRQARALARAGEANRAFALLRPMLKTNRQARQIYGEAVLGALKAGSIRPADARAFVSGYLRDKQIPLQQRKYMVYDLVALKAYDVVLPVVRELAASEPDTFTMLYIDALLQAKHKAEFAKAIERAIGRAKGVGELKMLGKMAFNENLQPAARKAFLKVQRLRPNDPQMLRYLGLIAFYRGKNETGRRLLTRYLATGVDDYKAEYELGEIITKFADWRRATPYFERALRKVLSLKSPTLEDLKLKAHLYYRTGNFAAASKTYERLIRLRPHDVKLRNKYIDFLIQTGRYERARELQRRS